MLTKKIIDLIKLYRDYNPQVVALKLAGKDLPLQNIIQQIEGRQKSKEKLPTWYDNDTIVFPARLSIEQASSETTANYKARLVQKGNLIDLTGGFGIDSYFFSKYCKSVDYVEHNEALFEIAKSNFNLLHANNVHCLNKNSTQLLQQAHLKFDTIYIDPARRSESGKKVFQLADCEPNVVENLDLYFQNASQILIKTSPLLDIDGTIADLRFVKEIHVVSVDNECKEVLYLLENNWIGEPQIHTVNFTKSRIEAFKFYRSEEKLDQIKYVDLGQYLYEPNASIMKSGAFKLISTRYKCGKIAPNTHLYTSDLLISDFPGKIFKLRISGKLKDFMSGLPNKKANVITRNYPLSAEQLKKKLDIKDGGEQYLIGFQNKGGKHEIAWAERVELRDEHS